MSNAKIDYEEDLAIDMHSLDVEWGKQALLVHQYSVLYADLCAYRDEAKEKLHRVDAEIDLDVRSDWDSFGFEVKPTEPAIKATILNDARHTKASDNFLDLNRQVAIVSGAKVALEHKKSALERLSSLLLSGYWAEPQIPQEAKEAVHNTSHEAHRKHLANNKRIK